jgi:hypothetical protein
MAKSKEVETKSNKAAADKGATSSRRSTNKKIASNVVKKNNI